MKQRYLEIFFGILIILISAIFVVYTTITVSNNNFKTYKISTVFNNIGPLEEGGKVIINGLKVGSVSKIYLSDDYSIIVILEINSNVKIPINSKVSITSAGFLDSPNINISPSKSIEYAKVNDILKNSTDWVSLEDKIGSIFSR